MSAMVREFPTQKGEDVLAADLRAMSSSRFFTLPAINAWHFSS